MLFVNAINISNMCRLCRDTTFNYKYNTFSYIEIFKVIYTYLLVINISSANVCRYF